MTILPISKARIHLADLGDRACHDGERIIIERHGKNLFAIVPIEDLELLQRMEDAADLKLIRERMKEPGIPWETAKKKLGL